MIDGAGTSFGRTELSGCFLDCKRRLEGAIEGVVAENGCHVFGLECFAGGVGGTVAIVVVIVFVGFRVLSIAGLGLVVGFVGLVTGREVGRGGCGVGGGEG